MIIWFCVKPFVLSDTLAVPSGITDAISICHIPSLAEVGLSQSCNKLFFSSGQKACWKKTPPCSSVTLVEESGEHLRSTLTLWTVEMTIAEMKLWGKEWCNRKSTNKVLIKKKPNNKKTTTTTCWMFWISLQDTLPQPGQPAWMSKVLRGQRYPECTGETKTLVLQPDTVATDLVHFVTLT